LAVHVARFGEAKYALFFVGNVSETDNLEDLAVDGRILLKWSLKELYVKTCTGLNWLRRGKNWRVHVAAVMKFLFHKIEKISRFFFFFAATVPPPAQWATAPSFARFLVHTQIRKFGRTPLDE